MISFKFKSNSLLQSYRSQKKVNQTVAYTGNQRREYRMAGDIPTAEALMLERSLSVLNLFMRSVGPSVVVSWFNLKRLISLKFKSNSSLKSLGSWIKVNQMV